MRLGLVDLGLRRRRRHGPAGAHRGVGGVLLCVRAVLVADCPRVPKHRPTARPLNGFKLHSPGRVAAAPRSAQSPGEESRRRRGPARVFRRGWTLGGAFRRADLSRAHAQPSFLLRQVYRRRRGRPRGSWEVVPQTEEASERLRTCRPVASSRPFLGTDGPKQGAFGLVEGGGRRVDALETPIPLLRRQAQPQHVPGVLATH